MADSRTMKSLLRDMIRVMVDFPEEIQIDCATHGINDDFRLCVAPSDTGKVIGKQGRHARAIREIFACASQAAQRRFTLDIVEAPSPEEVSTSPQIFVIFSLLHY